MALKSIVRAIKDPIRQVIRLSEEDGRERGFLFFKDIATGNLKTSTIYEGWKEEVTMDWFELLEDMDYSIEPLGNFHTHFETAIPSYTDVATTVNLSYELEENSPYIILLVNILQVDYDDNNTATIWGYELDLDSIEAQELRQFNMELSTICRKYSIWDIRQLLYRCSPEEEERIDTLEWEMRRIISDENIFYNVEGIDIIL